MPHPRRSIPPRPQGRPGARRRRHHEVSSPAPPAGLVVLHARVQRAVDRPRHRGRGGSGGTRRRRSSRPHHMHPVIHCACPGALRPPAPHGVVFNAIASIWNIDLTGTAGLGVPPVMSCGLVSSRWMAEYGLAVNLAVLPNPLTKLATSTTATVPAASEVEAIMS